MTQVATKDDLQQAVELLTSRLEATVAKQTATLGVIVAAGVGILAVLIRVL